MAQVQEALRDIYINCDISRFVKVLKVNFKFENNVKKEPEEEDYGDHDDFDGYNETGTEDMKVEEKVTMTDFTVKTEHPEKKHVTTDQTQHLIKKIQAINPIDSKDKTIRIRRKQIRTVFQCKKCGDDCVGQKNLNNHMKKIHGQKKKPQEQDISEKCTCRYCDKVMKNPYILNGHLALVHRDEAIKNHPEIEMNKACPHCDQMFFAVTDLDKHSITEHDKSARVWPCRSCGENFERKGILEKHRKEKHFTECAELGMYGFAMDKQCPYCDKQFNKTSNFRGHIYDDHIDKRSLHPDIQPLHTCQECCEQFYGSRKKTYHFKMMHTQNSKCVTCCKIFPNVFALERHTLSEHDDQVHICHICSKEFKKKSNLLVHMKKHTGLKEKQFVCSECPTNGKYATGKYHTQEGLDRHIQENHTNIKYICAFCPATFQNNHKRRGHEKRSHGDKNTPCEQCDKMFVNIEVKNHHVEQVHEKKMNKICPHCGEAFSSTLTFKSHVLRHTNDRQHSCEVCGKAFLIERDLKTHMKTHTKPFNCDLCDAKFGQKLSLQDHVRKDHDGIQVECRFGCGWKVFDRRNMTRHEISNCKLNPIPGAPYTVAMGTANKLALENFLAKKKTV